MKEWVKTFRFGAMIGAVLVALQYLLNFIFGKTVATIQFALIQAPLDAKVGIDVGLGTKLVTWIANTIGFKGGPNWFINLLIVIVGAGLAVVIGNLIYKLMHDQFKIAQPKSQVGRLALLIIYAGIASGFILGTMTGLPTLGMIWALVLGGVVTALILVPIMKALAKKNKFVANSLITL